MKYLRKILCSIGWHKWSAWQFVGEFHQDGFVHHAPYLTINYLPCHIRINERKCERCGKEEITTLR